mmetsp:Transcript_14357/g.36315  ORF Transcript_14357/g.36315 Transcript_14357/m.36315 type:complete len:343 (+) Transcript_14357:172-1200(+)
MNSGYSGRGGLRPSSWPPQYARDVSKRRRVSTYSTDAETGGRHASAQGAAERKAVGGRHRRLRRGALRDARLQLRDLAVQAARRRHVRGRHRADVVGLRRHQRPAGDGRRLPPAQAAAAGGRAPARRLWASHCDSCPVRVVPEHQRRIRGAPVLLALSRRGDGLFQNGGSATAATADAAAAVHAAACRRCGGCRTGRRGEERSARRGGAGVEDRGRVAGQRSGWLAALRAPVLAKLAPRPRRGRQHETQLGLAAAVVAAEDGGHNGGGSGALLARSQAARVDVGGIRAAASPAVVVLPVGVGVVTLGSIAGTVRPEPGRGRALARCRVQHRPARQRGGTLCY